MTEQWLIRGIETVRTERTMILLESGNGANRAASLVQLDDLSFSSLVRFGSFRLYGNRTVRCLHIADTESWIDAIGEKLSNPEIGEKGQIERTPKRALVVLTHR